MLRTSIRCARNSHKSARANTRLIQQVHRRAISTSPNVRNAAVSSPPETAAAEDDNDAVTARPPLSMLSIYLEPLRRTAEHNVPVCDLQLRSFNIRVLEFFCDFAMRAAYYLNIPAAIVPLPRITERWTVPKSNFIFKKSQQNFERVTHRRLIQLKDGSPESVELWLAFLRKHEYHGIGMKANVWAFEELGAGKRLGEALDTLKDIPGRPSWANFGNKVAPGTVNMLTEIMKDPIFKNKGAVEEPDEDSDIFTSITTEGPDLTEAKEPDHLATAGKAEEKLPDVPANTSQNAPPAVPSSSEEAIHSDRSDEVPKELQEQKEGQELENENEKDQIGDKAKDNSKSISSRLTDAGTIAVDSAIGSLLKTSLKEIEQMERSLNMPSAETVEAAEPIPTESEDAVAADRLKEIPSEAQVDRTIEKITKAENPTAKSEELEQVATEAVEEDAPAINPNLEPPSFTPPHSESSSDPPPPQPTSSEDSVAADRLSIDPLSKEAPSAMEPPVATAKEAQITENVVTEPTSDISPPPDPTTSEDSVAADHINANISDLEKLGTEVMTAKEVEMSVNEAEAASGATIEDDVRNVPDPDPTMSEDIVAADRLEAGISEIEKRGYEPLTAKDVQVSVDQTDIAIEKVNMTEINVEAPTHTLEETIEVFQKAEKDRQSDETMTTESDIVNDVEASTIAEDSISEDPTMNITQASTTADTLSSQNPSPTDSEEIVSGERSSQPVQISSPTASEEIVSNEKVEDVMGVSESSSDVLASQNPAPTDSEEILSGEQSSIPVQIPAPTESEEIISNIRVNDVKNVSENESDTLASENPVPTDSEEIVSGEKLQTPVQIPSPTPSEEVVSSERAEGDNTDKDPNEKLR